MHGRTLTTIALLLVAGLMTACNDGSKAQMTMLTGENQELRDQLEERDRALDATTSDLREANRLLREQQELMVVTTTTQGNPFAGIEGVSTTVDGNTITVSMEGDILFESGRSSLRSPSKNSLQQIANILKNDYQGQRIVIAGHTDSDPIRKSGFKSNHHLGFERGWAVCEYLTSRGVDSERIAVSSYGPNSPLDSKKASRRVEIVVADAN